MAILSFASSRLDYAGAHFGKSLLWHTNEFLAAFFLAEVFGIAPETLGWLLLLYMLWDAVTDPIVGRWLSKYARSTPDYSKAQLIGAIASGAAFSLFFWKPTENPTGLFYYAVTIGLVFRTAYTLYDVPQNALLKRLGSRDEEYAALSSLRNFFGNLSSFCIALLSTLVLAATSSAATESRWFFVAILLAGVAVASSALLHFCTNKRSGTNNLRYSTPAPRVEGTLEMLRQLPKKFYVLLGLVFLYAIFAPIFSKLLPFVGKYTIGDATWASFALTAMVIAMMISQPIWAFVSIRISYFATCVITTILVILGGFTIGVLVSNYPTMMIVGVMLVGAGIGGLNMVIWAELASVLASSDSRSDHSSDGIAFGLFTFFSKVGLGLGGLIIGWTLSMPGASSVEATGHASDSLLLTVSIAGPMLAGLLVVLIGPSFGLFKRAKDTE